MYEEYLPLNHADFHILLALADDEGHGYAIMLHVEELTEGSVRLGPGTLYTSIKRLLSSGMITESSLRPDAELDDQRRRYYRLSKLGGKVPLRRDDPDGKDAASCEIQTRGEDGVTHERH
jgi:DNA-binding PadR family transcriptional regulator